MERKIAKKKFKILMVCLGNICRSPMAQGAMEFMAKKNSLSLIVDSAGTQNWHFNKSPDQRAQNVATSKGWKISYQKARQILSSDFNNFDLIIGMDKSNIADIEKIRPKNSKTPVMLLLDFSSIKNKNLPDPYYTNDFEGVAKMIEIACDNLLVQYFNS